MNKPITETKKRELKAQLLWTALILMFFLIQGVIWTVAIGMTAQDKSHAVVAHYDEQALNWDEVKQQRQASEALGWQANIQVGETSDVQGNRVITLSLKDENQVPLENAAIELVAFHRARAAEPQNVLLNSVAPGVYSGNILVQKSGRWQFSGSAKSEEHQLLIEQLINLNSNRNL
jgi:hypothetical protein